MHPRQILAILVAIALNALDGFDVLSIAFAAPGIAKQWGIDKTALGIVLSMELAGMAIGAFMLGAQADKVGRRPTILASLVIMASGMALASVSTDVVMLSCVRLYTGLGIGGMIAAANAIVAECTSARRRDLAIAIMAGGYPLGAIIGGSVASALLANTGRWQAIFVFGAIASAAFIPIVLWLVPETIAFLCQRRPKGALERVNRVLRRHGRTPVDALPPLLEVSTRPRLGELFAPGLASVTILLSLSYFMHIMSFYFLMKWIPKVVVDKGFPAAIAGHVLVWANVGGAVGSIVLSLLTQKVAVRRLVIGAMVFSSLAVAAFGWNWQTIPSLSAAAAFAGFFANGAIAGLYAVLAQSFPTQLRGGGIGLVLGFARGGAALGPILAGFMLSADWSFQWVAATMASGCLLAALLLGMMRAPRRHAL